MTILEEIIQQKRKEVAGLKMERSLAELKTKSLFGRKCLSLAEFITEPTRTGIIAEFKRRSPSKGVINGNADVRDITRSYQKHGASGISVLTDEKFFGGSEVDLFIARENDIPLLRKDFIVDECQVVESKAMGADVILLIAACLSVPEVKKLSAIAKELGMEVLLEIHGEEELGHICDQVDMVGVNNRDLKTFTVDKEKSIQLVSQIPGNKIRIAESGIGSPEDILLLRKNGFDGFLIGERFMKEEDPGRAFGQFVEKLNNQPH